ncbi:MAG: hypothetical protein WCP45_11275 [Verrucomicrobiota bacterium]
MKLIQIKWLILVGGIAILAFVAGIVSYPAMRSQLTGLSAAAPPAPATTTQSVAPAPTPQALAPPATPAPVIDLSQLTPSQLPSQVTLNVATEVADASGLKLKVDAGSRLKLVRIEGDQVVVSPGTSPFEGRVPISGTDLMEQLAAIPPAPAAPVTDPGAATQPAATPDPAAVADPAATPPAAPSAAGPSPQPAAPAASSPAATGDTVEVMKAHIRGGGVKEFTFEQVLGWKAEADEVIDGSTYQTGIIRYKAETIFGEKTIEAKALLQDCKVVRWVWPKSGMEIK